MEFLASHTVEMFIDHKARLAKQNLLPVSIQVTKGFETKTSTWSDQTLINQPNKMGMIPKLFHTIPTFADYASCLLCA